MKKTVTITAAALIAAGILLFIFRKDNDSTDMLSSFREGCLVSYTMNIESKTQSAGSSFSSTTSGTLTIKPFKHDGTLRLAMQIAQPSVHINGIRNSSLENMLANIFYVDTDSYGAMNYFGFRQDIPEEHTDFIKGIIRSFDFVLRTEGRKSYTVKHNEDAVSYIASYSRDNGEFHKKKLRYIKNAGGESPQVTVLHSTATAKPDNSGCWLLELQGSERLRVRIIGSGDTTVETAVSLKKTDEENDSEFWSINNIEELEFSAKLVSERDITGKQQKAATPVKVTQNTLYSFIMKLDREHKISRESVLAMRKLFTDNPELLKELPCNLLKSNLQENTVSQIILSLGIVGIPEAQNALVEIASNSSFSKQNNFRAVLAFSELDKPLTPSAKDYLLGQFDNLGTEEDSEEIVSSAVLVAGAVAGNLGKINPEEANKLNSEMLELLENAENTEQERIMLTALGNSKIENNIPVLKTYLDNSNSRLQVAAVRALGKYDNAEATNAIIDHLDTGQDEDLSTFALKSLKGKDIGHDGVTKVADILLYSNNEQVRKYIIPLLAENKAQNPEEINSILKQAMQTETSKANLKMLIEAYARNR